MIQLSQTFYALSQCHCKEKCKKKLSNRVPERTTTQDAHKHIFTLLRMHCTLYCILFTLASIPSKMSAKRPTSLSPSTPRFKRQRKAVTLKVKLDIIKRHDRGEGTTEIGRAHAIAASTVHSIVQSSEKIKKISQIATRSSARIEDGSENGSERMGVRE